MPGDTIMRVVPHRAHLGEVIGDAVLRLVCRRFGHRWLPYGAHSAGLRHGSREYCGRCHSNRVTLLDGEQVVASAVQVRAAWRPIAEALYEARWGEPPRRKLRPGEWPAP